MESREQNQRRQEAAKAAQNAAAERRSEATNEAEWNDAQAAWRSACSDEQDAAAEWRAAN